jgi:Lrp/AsnC family leucine-responsive transcriptional regulator
MSDLDRIDRALLGLLQEDGRRTVLDLAQRVGLSPTGASQRIKRLFSEGFIRAVRAVLEPSKIGRGTLVFIEVRLDHTAPHVFDRFAEAVAKAPEIIECHMVIGGFDYLVKARIADMATFQEFLQAGHPAASGCQGNPQLCIDRRCEARRAIAAVTPAYSSSSG